jgi:Bacterial SH3 domain.
MGLRFRRTVKLLPGVRLNLSRSGVSTTVGVRGASVTVGKQGTYANVGLPGSGVSYRTRIDGEAEGSEPRVADGGRKRSSLLPILVALALGGGALAFFGLKTPRAQAPVPATPIAAAPVAAAPATPAAPAETVTIAKRSTALKAEPSRKSEKIGTAHQGDSFTVFSRQGVWLQVGHDHAEGWIAASATRP